MLSLGSDLLLGAVFGVDIRRKFGVLSVSVCFVGYLSVVMHLLFNVI